MELPRFFLKFSFEKCNTKIFFISFISEQKSQLSGEEQEKKITTYEEAMSKIKDATGVSDIQVSFLYELLFVRKLYFCRSFHKKKKTCSSATIKTSSRLKLAIKIAQLC